MTDSSSFKHSGGKRKKHVGKGKQNIFSNLSSAHLKPENQGHLGNGLWPGLWYGPPGCGGVGGLQGAMSDSESTITGTLGPQPLRPRGLPSPVTWCSCCSGKETPLACAEDTGGQNTACLLEEPPESRVPPLPR